MIIIQFMYYFVLLSQNFPLQQTIQRFFLVNESQILVFYLYLNHFNESLMFLLQPLHHSLNHDVLYLMMNTSQVFFAFPHLSFQLHYFLQYHIITKSLLGYYFVNLFIKIILFLKQIYFIRYFSINSFTLFYCFFYLAIKIYLQHFMEFRISITVFSFLNYYLLKSQILKFFNIYFLQYFQQNYFLWSSYYL